MDMNRRIDTIETDMTSSAYAVLALEKRANPKSAEKPIHTWTFRLLLMKGFSLNEITRVLARWNEPKNFIIARIDHGRWIVDCPHCAGSAELVSFTEPVFWCTQCQNAQNNTHPYRIAFPKERKTIETLLLMRPKSQRNWFPNETIADLARENLDHADELNITR